jgi:hypothetical protein
MKTKRADNVIPFPCSKFEEAEDRNEEIVASTKSEHRKLLAAEEVVIRIDREDGKIGNNPHIEHLKSLIRESKQDNEFQHMQSSECMRIYDRVYKFPGGPNSAA